jgi:hypothetical protein
MSHAAMLKYGRLFLHPWVGKRNKGLVGVILNKLRSPNESPEK